MPNTITAYHTFVGGTKARAAQVNTNFSNHRGHLMPIDPNTATAVTNTYDLGSAEYQWRNIYLKNPPVIGGANSNRFEIPVITGGNVPPADMFDVANVQRLGFMPDADMDVHFSFIVPAEYVSGNPISLEIRGFSDATGGSTFISTAHLYQNTTTSNIGLTAPAQAFTATSNVNMPSTTGLYFKNSTLRLTGAAGTLGSVLVASGDKIAVQLKRNGTATADTLTGAVFLTDVIVDLNL